MDGMFAHVARSMNAWPKTVAGSVVKDGIALRWCEVQPVFLNSFVGIALRKIAIQICPSTTVMIEVVIGMAIDVTVTFESHGYDDRAIAVHRVMKFQKFAAAIDVSRNDSSVCSVR